MGTLLEFKGRVAYMSPVEKVSTAKGDFEKQSILIEEDGQYPNQVTIEAFGEQIKELNGITVGMDVTAKFNPNGREYKGKLYGNNRLFKLITNGQRVEQHSTPIPSDKTDDLPF